jgi:hypothetical protein
MLRLLLDEHLSPRIAEQLRRHRPEFDAQPLQEWQSGLYFGAEDAVILSAAAADRRTLLTFDQRTIVPLLCTWASSGMSHGGVILVDERTIAPGDIGGIVRAVLLLFGNEGTLDWHDRVRFLKP